MHSKLIVARMDPGSSAAVARIFSSFDSGEMPGLMGTVRRQLFTYNGLYFHLQDFEVEDGGVMIENMKSHPAFMQISDDLKSHITAFDPATWRSPSDAMATSFYHWSRS
ncbi:TcmI family type II polyketide cyclase [Nocardia otitidiscaviarum]|uniref:TcmI family type II polyketide cyclase n=1 Tax=Nocardia otitidiscaviarum TaxID=1823 RepID=UPI00245733E2|nr:TcmI family type II polyketide cyclase [Nocardia otitidiscaviarum]